jgi:hypothetical protein
MASAPVALGLAGISSVLVISGIQGKSIGSIISGDFGPAPDPKGPGTSAEGEQAAQTVSAGSAGASTLDGHLVAPWIVPILLYARSKGWKGHVTSGYRSKAEQTKIYNSGVRPAAAPGTSNHEGLIFPSGAVDVTEAAQLSQILLHSQYAKVLVYAGAKDPVHFSHPHNGSY